MKTINLNESLSQREKQCVEDTLTPLRIEQLVEYMESKALHNVGTAISNIGLLNGNYYLLENVHAELRHFYKVEV